MVSGYEHIRDNSVTTKPQKTDASTADVTKAAAYVTLKNMAAGKLLKESTLESERERGSINLAQYAELLPLSVRGTTAAASKPITQAKALLEPFRAGPGALRSDGQPKAAGSLARRVTISWIADGKTCSAQATIMGVAEAIIDTALACGCTPTVAFTWNAPEWG